MRSGSAQIANLAPCMINAGQGSLDLRRQGLADDVGIEAAEILADGSQEIFIRDRNNSSSTFTGAPHRRLQITAKTEVARR